MKDPIRGNTIRWTFSDGPTKDKAFEHDFKVDGSLAYRMAGSDKSTSEKRYETTQVSDKVFAVSYLASSGWTLTSILDFETGKVVSFASNKEQLIMQRGEFEIVAKKAA